MKTRNVNTAAYEAESVAARRRIGSTIGQIQHRLNPKTIAHDAIDAAMQRGTATVRHAALLMSEHVMTLSIAGAVIGALLGTRGYVKHKRKSSMTQYDDEFEIPSEVKSRMAGVKQTAGHVRDAVAEKAGAARDYSTEKLAAAREYTTETWEATRERAGEYAEKAKFQARRAREKTSEGIEHNPLTAVLVGAAAGAIIAALLPRTRQENDALGGTRDRLTDKAKSAARAARDAGKARFDDLGVKEQAQAQLRELRGSAAEIARTAKDAAKRETGHEAGNGLV